MTRDTASLLTRLAAVVLVTALIVAAAIFFVPDKRHDPLGGSDPVAYQHKYIRDQFMLVRGALENRLRNPASLQLRDVKVDEKLLAFCGEYNAENGFGGMTGFKPFVAYMGWPYVQDDADYEKMHASYCDKPERLKPMSEDQLR